MITFMNYNEINGVFWNHIYFDKVVREFWAFIYNVNASVMIDYKNA